MMCELPESDGPVRRFQKHLTDKGTNFETFGVFRSDALSKTTLHRSYYSSDRALVYYLYNATGRKDAAKHIKSDTRSQPGPREPMALDAQLRIVCPAGGAILFSGAQMHSTVPNTSGLTRFSLDFRTVNLTDLESKRGAPNVDTYSQGTSLRDFRRSRDGAPMPESIVARYDSGDKPEGAMLVFAPETAS
jgi:hypothetical protein